MRTFTLNDIEEKMAMEAIQTHLETCTAGKEGHEFATYEEQATTQNTFEFVFTKTGICDYSRVRCTLCGWYSEPILDPSFEP